MADSKKYVLYDESAQEFLFSDPTSMKDAEEFMKGDMEECVDNDHKVVLYELVKTEKQPKKQTWQLV